MYLEILWELGVILAIIYIKKSKFIKMSIFMFVFSFCAYLQSFASMQDSIFVIRKKNIIGPYLEITDFQIHFLHHTLGERI